MNREYLGKTTQRQKWNIALFYIIGVIISLLLVFDKSLLIDGFIKIMEVICGIWLLYAIGMPVMMFWEWIGFRFD